MGGDGGVCATDRRFIRGCSGNVDSAAKDVEQTAKQQQVIRTHHCALSGERLAEPIVACELGGMYNKEAVIAALLDRTLNDIKQLILTALPGYREASEVEGELPPRYCCPVTRVEMNGIHPFVVVWPTGHVLSEKALKEVGVPALQDEYGPFSDEDIIRLIPSEDLLPGMRASMETRRANSSGKKKKRAREETGGSSTVASNVAIPAGNADVAAAEGDSQSKETNPIPPARGDGTVRAEKAAKSAHSSSSSAPLPAAQAAAVSSRPSAVSGAHLAAGEALSHVDKKATESDVYKKLFHKDSKKNDKDLFMNVAGFRYGLS